MFDSIAAKFLSNHVGKYIAGDKISPDHLHLRILSGELELDDIEIDTQKLTTDVDIFAFNLDLFSTMQLLGGKFSKLVLDIPWKTLLLPIGPHPTLRLDSPRIVFRQSKGGSIAMEELEARKKKALLAHESGENLPKPASGFMQSAANYVAMKIGKTLEVTATDIRVRLEVEGYEMRGSEKSDRTAPHCCFDVHIKKLSVSSDHTSDFKESKRTIKVEQLSVLWKRPTGDEVMSIEDDSDMEVIIPPTDTEIIFESALKSQNINLLVEALGLVLSETHWADMMLLLDNFTTPPLKYKELRPQKALKKGSARSWWHYAIEAAKKIAYEKRKVWTWDYLRDRLQRRRDYIRLWIGALQNQLNEEQQRRLVELEEYLSFDDISVYRSLAEVAYERKEYRASDKTGLFANWRNSNELVSLDFEQLKHLYEEIGYGEYQSKNDFNLDLYLKQFNIKLIEGGKKKKGMTIVDGVITGATLEYSKGEREMVFSFGVDDAKFTDYYVNPKNPIEFLKMQVNETEPEKKYRLLAASFEQNTPVADFRVSLCVEPLDLIVLQPTINRMRKFFWSPFMNPGLEDLQREAVIQWEQLQKQAATQIKYAINQAKSLELLVDVKAPIVCIPQEFENPTESNCLIANLGELSITTDLNATPQEDLLNPVVSDDYFFDKFKIGFSSLSVSLQTILRGNKQRIEIIKSFDLFVAADRSRVTNTVLPLLKLNCKVPPLTIRLAPEHIGVAMQVINNFMSELDKGDTEIEDNVESVPRVFEAQETSKVHIRTESVDQSLIDATLNFDNISLKILDSNENAKEVFEISLSDLKGFVKKTSKSMELSMDFGDIKIEDTYSLFGEDFKHWVALPSRGDQFFKLKYITQSDGKQLANINGSGNSLEVEIGTLQLLLSKETMTVIKQLSETISAMTASKESREDESPKEKKQSNPLKIGIQLQNLVLKLKDPTCFEGSLEVKQPHFAFCTDDQFSLQAKFKSLELLDLMHPGTLWPSIGFLDGDDTLFSIKTLPPGKYEETTVVQLDAGVANIVFFEDTLSGFVQYISNIQEVFAEPKPASATSESVVGAGEVSKPRSSDKKDWTRFKLAVRNAKVTLPESKSTQSHFSLFGSGWTVSNQLEKVLLKGTAVGSTETTFLKVESLNVLSHYQNISRQLLQQHVPVCLQFGKPWNSDTTQILAILNEAHLMLTNNDIGLLYTTFGLEDKKHVQAKPKKKEADAVSVRFTFDKLHIGLGETLYQHLDSFDSVATVFISNGDLQWQQTKSDNQILTFDADSIAVLDDYHLKSQLVPDGFVKISKAGSGEDKAFKLQLYTSEVSTKEIKIQLGTTALQLYPELSSKLPQYFIALPDTLSAFSTNPKLLETKKLPEKKEQQQTPRDAPTLTESGGEGVNYSINFESKDTFQATIMKQRNQYEGSFVINLKPNFTYYAREGDYTQLSLIASNFSLSRPKYSHPNTASSLIGHQSIISPCEIGLQTILYDKEKYALALTPLTAVISYHDIIHLSEFKVAWERAYNDVSQVLESRSPAAPKKQSSKPKGLKPQYLSVTCPEMNLFITDDCKTYSELPLLSLFMNNLEVSCSDWSTSPEGDFIVQPGINFYNPYVGDWETVLEPVDMYLKISNKGDDVRNMTLNTGHIETTLTKVMVETAIEVYNHWFGEEPAEEPKKKSLYYIRNETGSPLIYWIPQLQSKQITIPNGREEAVLLLDEEFGYTREMLQTKQDLNTKHYTLTVQIGDAQPCVNIPIRTKGTHFFLLHTEGVPEPLPLIYTVMYEEKSKILLFKSNVEIENTCESAIELLFETDPTLLPLESNRSVVSIPPNSKYSVPLQFVKESTVRVAPDPQLEYVFSSFSYPLSKLEEGVKHIRCTPKNKAISKSQHTNGSNSSWLFSVDVKETRERIKTPVGQHIEKPRIFKLRFHPVAIVENLLLHDMHFRLIDDATDQTLLQATLRSGETQQIHQLPKIHDVKIIFTVAGYEWSEPMEFFRFPLRNHIESREIPHKKNYDAKLLVQMSFINNHNGVPTLALWTNYWVINNMDIPLTLATSGTLSAKDHLYEFAPSSLPVMYGSNRNKRLNIRVGKSYWSDAIDLSAQNMVGYVEAIEDVNPPENRQVFEVAVGIEPAPNKFWRSKVITFNRRYTLHNKNPISLFLRQKGTSKEVELRSNEPGGFHWPCAFSEKLLSMRLAGSDHWSGYFSLDSLGTFTMALKDSYDEKHYVTALVALHNGAIFVSFVKREEPEYMIHNETPLPLTIHQKEESIYQTIEPFHTEPFTWENVMQSKELEVDIGGRKKLMFLFDALKSYPPVKLPLGTEEDKSVLIYPSIESNEQTTTLKFSIAVPPPVEEYHGNELTYNLKIAVQSLGISVVDEEPQEILYFYMKKIGLSVGLTPDALSFVAKVERIQIDNEADSPYPVVLWVAPPQAPDETEKEKLKSMNVDYSNSAARVAFVLTNKPNAKNIIAFNYFSLTLQQINVALDEVFLLKIMNLEKSIEAFLRPPVQQVEEQLRFSQGEKLLHPNKEVEDMIVEKQKFKHLNDDEALPAKKLYFEVLQINPIAANLSFLSIPGTYRAYLAENKEVELEVNPFERWLGIIGALTDVENATIALHGLILENPHLSIEDLKQIIFEHYKTQLLSQVYKVVGNANFLGSPASFFGNIGTGFYDFFHEPAHSLVHKPRELLPSIKKGTSSLLKNAVFSIADSTNRFGSSLTKAATQISRDEKWQRERVQRNQKKPETPMAGAVEGIKDFGKGVISGLSGIWNEPAQEVAKDKSVKGLMKGAFHGLAGAVLKPAVGTVDLFTRTAEGLRSATGGGAAGPVERVRPPREFGEDGVVRPMHHQPLEVSPEEPPKKEETHGEATPASVTAVKAHEPQLRDSGTPTTFRRSVGGR